MRNINIVLVLFFSLVSQGISFCQEIDVDSIAFTDSLPVEIIYNRSVSGNQIKLGRNHFLSFPGSFDDPSRLLLKYPGISTQNDQANFIIYDGMPPHFVKWTLYGADIVNPNHLSNAGTISDRNSRSSGGVNSFSGQILGNFSFNAQPGIEGDLITHAGSADMKLRTPFENKLFFNISAIGLEAGIERKLNDSGTSNLIANYRYSFTGLLGQMGVDFGGEVIGFQDVFAKVELDNTLGGKLSMFGSYGASFNDHAAQDSVALFKDGLEIRYDANIAIAGINHISDSKQLNTTIVYSNRSDDRRSTKPIGFLPDLDIGTLNSRFEESRISLHSKFTTDSNRTVGIKASNFNYNPDAILDEALSITEPLNYTEFYPYFLVPFTQNEKLDLKFKLGAYFETLFEQISILPALSAKYMFTDRFSVGLNYNITSQMQAPELYKVEGGSTGPLSTKALDRSLAHHIKFKLSYSDFSVSPFYHRFSSLPGPSAPLDAISEIYSNFSNLDRIPNQLLDNTDNAEILGVSIDGSKSTVKDLHIDFNLSVFSSKTNNLLLSEYRNPYDFGQVFNLRVHKRFTFSDQKFLNISSAFHYRGGAREMSIGLEESRELGRTVFSLDQDVFGVVQRAYHRMDLRISYVKKKPNNRKYKSVVSLDIQNLYGRENDAYHYYDPVTDQVELQKQLGLLPVISYRLEF